MSARSRLDAHVHLLNIKLERPTTVAIGHFLVDSNSSGVKLSEITSSSGGETDWSPRMTASELDNFVSGIMFGINLRNTHLANTRINAR